MVLASWAPSRSPSGGVYPLSAPNATPNVGKKLRWAHFITYFHNSPWTFGPLHGSCQTSGADKKDGTEAEAAKIKLLYKL